MIVRLTLQEKLRDLRDVAEATGIPLATLGRIESNEDNQTSYQSVAALAIFLCVNGLSFRGDGQPPIQEYMLPNVTNIVFRKHL